MIATVDSDAGTAALASDFDLQTNYCNADVYDDFLRNSFENYYSDARA